MVSAADVVAERARPWPSEVRRRLWAYRPTFFSLAACLAALAAWEWRDFWIYLAGPIVGTALGGLAAAGLANFSLRLFHPEDVTIMLLVWHIGGVFALSALAAVAGRYLMNWRSITSASQSAAQ